jgi:hypothetical protein
MQLVDRPMTYKSVLFVDYENVGKVDLNAIPADEGQGTNALDVHIALYLGEYLTMNVAADCIILPKDKGFDPLVTHLRGRKFNVRRAITLSEAFAWHSGHPETASCGGAR